MKGWSEASECIAYKENNYEPLATSLDHELIAKFAKGFMELYNGIKLEILGGIYVFLKL